jgi:hypothetical protein
MDDALSLLTALVAALATTCLLGLYLIWRRRRPAATGEPWTRADRLTLTGTVCSAAVGLITLVVSTLHGTPAPPAAGAAPPPPGPDLQIASVTVTDPSPQQPAPTLGIRLRNVGTQVSSLTAVTLTIRAFGILNICEAGGVSYPTATYPVSMPVPAEPGTVVTAPISQDLPPNSADNFLLTVGVEPFSYTISQAPAHFLYVVDLAVTHDGAAPPVSAGAAVLLVPADVGQASEKDFRWFLIDNEDDPSWRTPESAPVLRCYQDNRALLEQARAVVGARPPALDSTPGIGS